MRGRLLAAWVIALASVTFWAGALPFAQTAPVAVAYSVANPDGPAADGNQAAQQTAIDVAFSDRGLADYSVASFVRPAFITPQRISVPLALTQAPTEAPATPGPTPTPRPDPTAIPRPDPTAIPRPDPTATARPRQTAEPTAAPTRAPDPTARPSATPAPAPKPTAAPATYTGASHFWYPALNIDADWNWYGCDYGGGSTLPMGVFRWGCGPASNIYLLSHAASTFSKVRKAFHDGTLQVGQNVWYSNAQGDVTRWEVSWIRRVTDDYLNATASEWALSDSPTPIMTLQTCDGAQSQLRIIVRLIPAD